MNKDCFPSMPIGGYNGLRFKFSAEEDAILKDIVSQNAFTNWALIARMFNERCATILRKPPVERTERQCRDRYHNYLSPDVNNSPWNHEEDSIIIEKYQQYGPRWSLISRFLCGRRENAVKNRIKYLLRNTRSQQTQIQFSKSSPEPPSKICCEDEKSTDSIFNIDFSDISIPDAQEIFQLNFP